MHSIWAIADLHLSFGISGKEMDIFGPEWKDWTDKIAKNWKEKVQPNDLVLLAGDLSWAMKLSDAAADFEWIDSLPGTKVIIRGNHDYWWSSKSQVKKALPSSIHMIQNDTFNWENVSIGGARLWDTPEYSFRDVIAVREGTVLTEQGKDEANNERIFERELTRLELSLKSLDQSAKHRIAMVHYPPIGLELEESRVAKLLKRYNVDICVFGHLHSLKKGLELFGEHDGVKYILTSCDYLDFELARVL